MFLQSQKFTLQDEVLFHRFGNSSYLVIHQRHNFLPILALILLKLNYASNRPVYFRDLCAAYSALHRPGQGFWVYGILGIFNSGIWYFLVKIFRYLVFCFKTILGIKYHTFTILRYIGILWGEYRV